MNLGPLHAPLREILRDKRSGDLILVGGASILVKRDWLARTEAPTLMRSIPPARATQDLDFALKIELFCVEEKGRQVRELMDALGYEPQQPNWQFEKGDVQIDFLARQPEGDELQSVKFDEMRVSRKPTIHLHGRTTPEAFAIESLPITLDVHLTGEDESIDVVSAVVAHPYGLLNMKVRAAHDRYRCKRQGTSPKPYSEKHAHDVYALIAAITEKELAECSSLEKQFQDKPIAMAIRDEAVVLFSTPEAEGCREAERQLGQPIDHGVFWEALQKALGIEGA